MTKSQWNLAAGGPIRPRMFDKNTQLLHCAYWRTRGKSFFIEDNSISLIVNAIARVFLKRFRPERVAGIFDRSRRPIL